MVIVNRIHVVAFGPLDRVLGIGDLERRAGPEPVAVLGQPKLVSRRLPAGALDSDGAEERFQAQVARLHVGAHLEPASPDSRDRDLLADDVAVAYRSAVIATQGLEPPLTGARPGFRAPHAWLEHDGQRRSMLDLYDGRLTVVTGAEGHVWRRGVDALAARGRPVRSVALGRDVPDPGGAIAARYRLGTTGAVLVRPDGYVAWRRRHGSTDASRLLHAAGEAALGMRRMCAPPPPTVCNPACRTTP